MKELAKKNKNATSNDVLIGLFLHHQPWTLPFLLQEGGIGAINPLGYVLRCLLTIALILFSSVVLLHRDRGNKSL